jgi:hypothetical protein
VRPLRLPTLESAALVAWPTLPPGPRKLMPVLPDRDVSDPVTLEVVLNDHY